MRQNPLPQKAEVEAATRDAAATQRAASASAEGHKRVEESDDALLMGDPTLAMASLHLGRMVEKAAEKLFGDDTPKGMAFLTALAQGADASWPADSYARLKGAGIRAELIAVLGVPFASALLRGLTRDGRLYPGLALPIDPANYVNSEKGKNTPPEQVARWFAGEPAEAIFGPPVGPLPAGPLLAAG